MLDIVNIESILACSNIGVLSEVVQPVMDERLNLLECTQE